MAATNVSENILAHSNSNVSGVGAVQSGVRMLWRFQGDRAIVAQNNNKPTTRTPPNVSGNLLLLPTSCSGKKRGTFSNSNDATDDGKKDVPSESSQTGNLVF